MDSKCVEDLFKISLYGETPKHIRTIRELETICIHRLNLYESLKKARYNFSPYINGYSPEWKQYLAEEISKAQLGNFVWFLQTSPETVNSAQDHYKDDESGHFMLALVSSKETELKKFFLNLEIDWFQLKFETNIAETNIQVFLKRNNINVAKATTTEILHFKDIVTFYELNVDDLPIVYKVPFQEVTDLVAKREVVLKYGQAYFPNQVKYVSSVMRYVLTKRWKEKVDKLSKYWSSEPDERMVDLVETFLPDFKKLARHTGFVDSGKLSSGKIDDHAAHYFPLCIAKLHKLFKEKSHLKHFGRQQYAVFLKNAGMVYEDAMEFFEEVMTNKMSKEEFTKRRYQYYFSHCFGKEGARIDFNPQSCEDIIKNTPGYNLEHGCPFAHSDENSLTTLLKEKGLSDDAIVQIVKKKRAKKYQEGCVLYFNTVSKHGCLECVTSPNEYYACAAENVVDIEDIFRDSD